MPTVDTLPRRRLKSIRCRLRVILPGLWGLATLGSMRHPGDEYGCLLGSAIAGAWPLMFIHFSGHPTDAFGAILIVGLATMFLFGYLSDRVRVPMAFSLAVWAILAAIICTTSIRSYPSLERAISKNGSIATYVFLAMNLALYLTTLFMLVATPIFGLNRYRPKRGVCPACGYDLRGATAPRCPECGDHVADCIAAGG